MYLPILKLYFQILQLHNNKLYHLECSVSISTYFFSNSFPVNFRSDDVFENVDVSIGTPKFERVELSYLI